VTRCGTARCSAALELNAYGHRPLGRLFQHAKALLVQATDQENEALGASSATKIDALQIRRGWGDLSEPGFALEALFQKFV
jgi:hypothetical protein